jgi:hypothetical protein
VLQAREHAPTPSPYVVFTFGLEVQSLKVFGGASFISYKYTNLWFGFKYISWIIIN